MARRSGKRGKTAKPGKMPPGRVDGQLAAAVQAFQQGRLYDAEKAGRRALALSPDHPVALHVLGVVARRQGAHAEARDLLARAVAAQPDYAAAYNDLGAACFDLGLYDEAVGAHERGLALQPNDIGQIMNLGNARRAQGRLDDAVACYERALGLSPGLAGAHASIGMVRRGQGDAVAAAGHFRRAVELDPGLAPAWIGLGKSLAEAGDLVAARPALERAVESAPSDAKLWYFLGAARRAAGDPAATLAAFERASDLRSDFAAAHNNLGLVLFELDRLDDAIAAYDRALAVDPGFADALNNLGNARREQGRLDDAIALYEQALASRPDMVKASTNIALTVHALPGIAPDQVLACHEAWDAAHGAPLRAHWRDHANDRDPERRLKVGLVSADFGFHPVGYFTVGFVERHDRAAIELTCYCGRPADAMTKRFRNAAEHWVDTQALSDAALAERIAADGIDVLFDLSGHTTANRLVTFAMKPAPVQISWSGYPGTTGLAAMDHLVCDPRHVGAGEEEHHTERLIRLPDAFVCYEAPATAPEVGPLPALANGCVTFGCFSNPSKINPGLLARWGRIMRAVPDSRLVLIYRHLDHPANSDRILAALAKHGIAVERIEVHGKRPPDRFMEGYNTIDIALDTHPYSGGATTCEALWMGVPVLTLPGATFASRHALSLLTAAGMAEFAATDEDDYLARATALAGDPQGLAEIRAGLRARMEASALCDAVKFTATLEAEIRRAWRAWCEG
ncbi:MAG: tetratricopeptide repeat protein [Rhodospirillaceae bacterium]